MFWVMLDFGKIILEALIKLPIFYGGLHSGV